MESGKHHLGADPSSLDGEASARVLKEGLEAASTSSLPPGGSERSDAVDPDPDVPSGPSRREGANPPGRGRGNSTESDSIGFSWFFWRLVVWPKKAGHDSAVSYCMGRQGRILHRVETGRLCQKKEHDGTEELKPIGLERVSKPAKTSAFLSEAALDEPIHQECCFMAGPVKEYQDQDENQELGALRT